MQHKYVDHEKYPTMNTINYMSSQFLPGSIFMGFIPSPDEYAGMQINDVNCFAIHLFTEPMKRTKSDEGDKEQRYLDKGYNILLVIYGSDNTSYMKRFKRYEEAVKWIQKTKELVRDDSWLWYNS